MPSKNRVVLDGTRSQIDASGIIDLLQGHVFGGKKTEDLSTSQLRAAEILLKKIVPDLGSATLVDETANEPTRIEVTWASDPKKALPDPSSTKPQRKTK
jgi:hypothetical protein